MTDLLTRTIYEFRNGRDLPHVESAPVLDALTASKDEALLRDVLTAWNAKGIAADEIYNLARLLRARCVAVRSPHRIFVDIVGTGGSRSKTFNVSTSAAFVVAGGGLPVAKHGNKAASSRTGSADVLAALGVTADAGPGVVEKCLSELGICFMFAPNHHRLSPTLAKVRREIGEPTIFNCVGPLCNPAAAPFQLIGVWAEDMVDKMAAALAKLGTLRSWVVHGDNGLDEISLEGKTSVADVSGRSISRFEVSPADFGVEGRVIDEWNRATPEESADVIRGILTGEEDFKLIRDLVIVNAAAAFYLAGRAETLIGGATLARESIESGKALDKLNSLAAATG